MAGRRPLARCGTSRCRELTGSMRRGRGEDSGKSRRARTVWLTQAQFEVLGGKQRSQTAASIGRGTNQWNRAWASLSRVPVTGSRDGRRVEVGLGVHLLPGDCTLRLTPHPRCLITMDSARSVASTAHQAGIASQPEAHNPLSGNRPTLDPYASLEPAPASQGQIREASPGRAVLTASSAVTSA